MKAVVGELDRLARAGAVLFATLAIVPALAADATDDFRILYFEPLTPLPAADAALAQLKTNDSVPPALSFDAYGRRFELALEKNSKLMQDATTTAVAYRGSVVQQAGSWARLTSIGDELHGMIWDGADLYIIEPAGDAREFMVAPLDPAQTGNVIYRLSDTLVDLGPDFCSAIDIPPEESADGLVAFEALTNDLKSQTIMQQAPGAALSLRLSALGDASLRQRYDSDAEARDAILVRLNNVDGIFSAQLGVEIQVSGVSIYDDNTEPFSSTRDSGNLLTQLGNVRNSSSALRADGLTHLFTGRDLTGRDQNNNFTNNTVGIGYINGLCSNRYGAGITESRGQGETLESLIAAHEVGHNFGAVHDGSGVCNSTPPNRFIMAPVADWDRNDFSQCSVDSISRSMAYAACINTLPPADLAAVFAASPEGLTAGQTFAWSVTVTNFGAQQATETAVVLTLPTGILVDDATVSGGSCSSGAGAVQCALGPLPGNESRTVDLHLTAQSSGLSTVTALASATNETNTSNNSASAVLAIDAAAPVIGNPAAPASGSSGGGGGGGMQFLLLIALSPLAMARRRRRTVA